MIYCSRTDAAASMHWLHNHRARVWCKKEVAPWRRHSSDTWHLIFDADEQACNKMVKTIPDRQNRCCMLQWILSWQAKHSGHWTHIRTLRSYRSPLKMGISQWRSPTTVMQLKWHKCQALRRVKPFDMLSNKDTGRMGRKRPITCNACNKCAAMLVNLLVKAKRLKCSES